jgi:DNA-binding transcriptional LysR family regulator
MAILDGYESVSIVRSNFVQVVDHGGFAPAARAIGVPKSKLSRRIADLEKRLGVRLIQRSTRSLSVTEN